MRSSTCRRDGAAPALNTGHERWIRFHAYARQVVGRVMALRREMAAYPMSTRVFRAARRRDGLGRTRADRAPVAGTIDRSGGHRPRRPPGSDEDGCCARRSAPKGSCGSSSASGPRWHLRPCFLPAAAQVQRDDIAVARQRVQPRGPRQGATDVTRFEFIPFIALQGTPTNWKLWPERPTSPRSRKTA